MIGQVVNYRYEILEKAGDGDFYSVYKARDKVLNRLVAVKVLTVGPENKDFAERTVAEVQSVQDLIHPNIARVYECDANNGTYFTAVEYVRGINLKDRIRRTAPFTISYAVDIAIAVAEALDYAHKRGIVHGDVRPHNILTSPEGQVKITDFGLQAAVSAFADIRESSMARSIHYTAPEVLKGKVPQPASDIYSLGAVIYEMITGCVPFDGEGIISIAAKHIDEPPTPPIEINPGIPKMLNEIVLKALAKDPRMRYASMAEMLKDLCAVREYLRSGQTPGKSQAKAEPALLAEPEPIEETNLRATILTLLGVFVIMMGIGVLAVYLGVVKLPSQIKVPDFTGMTLEEAQRIAEREGLQLEQYRLEYNDRYPEGQIYLTAPPPGGSVSKDNPVVRLWISKGPKYVPVPSLVGLAEGAATERLGQAKLLPRIRREYSDSVPAGMVIRQDPEAGTKIEPLKQVTIYVSKGPQLTDIGANEEGSERPEEPTIAPRSDERLINVRITVPVNGPRTQEVRILVTDDQGVDQVVYDQVHNAGDEFTEPVRAYGDVVTLKVEIDGEIIWTKTFRR